MKASANRLIAYHAPIAGALTAERTSYSSQLIPVTAYIIVGCCEAFLRYPEMMRHIDAALPAEKIALAGHRPGTEINSVHLWSIANFWLLGRKILTSLDPSLDDPAAAFTVLDFWERAALAYRADGTRQAWDDGACRPFGADVIADVAGGRGPRHRRGRAGPHHPVQRHRGQPPVPHVVRHPLGHRRHRALPAAGRTHVAGP